MTGRIAAAVVACCALTAAPAHAQEGGGCGQIMFGSDGAEVFKGASKADFFNGLGGADRLSGGSNDDCLWGDHGNDRIEGGGNDDHLVGGAGMDTIDGGSGVDYIVGDNDYHGGGFEGAYDEVANASDRISGGSGGDYIVAVGDGVSGPQGDGDVIDCGSGEDWVEADPSDTVASNCEHVYRYWGYDD